MRRTGKNCITVGHDCAGIESPLFALQQLKIPYKHVFSSDINEHSLSFIRSNTNPELLYRDITKRDVNDVPHVQLYICGFPCQMYSRLNQQQKVHDPRKYVVEAVLEYIEVKHPDCFVMENVKGLLSSRKGEDWRHITTRLDALRQFYVWDWKILDAQDFGTPQSRPRVWIVGILKSKAESKVRRVPWPKKQQRSTTCLDLIDRTLTDGDPSLCVSPCYIKHLKVWNILDSDEGLIEFNGSSRTFNVYKHPKVLTQEQIKQIVKTDVSNTLISHDPGMCYKYPGGIRKCTVEECLRLQGFDPSLITVPHITSLQMKSLIGNSMCVSVLKALLDGLVQWVQVKLKILHAYWNVRGWTTQNSDWDYEDERRKYEIETNC